MLEFLSSFFLALGLGGLGGLLVCLGLMLVLAARSDDDPTP